MKHFLIISFLVAIVFTPATAQSPYTLAPHTEIPIIGFGGITVSYALFLHKNHPILTQRQVSAIDTTLLALLDLPTIHYNDKNADRISSIMLGLSFFSFALPAFDPSMRDDYLTY